METRQQLGAWRKQVADAGKEAKADFSVALRLLNHGTEALNEIARLREALQRIAEHHEEQRAVWADECGDADNSSYHEERRNFAMFHLLPNAAPVPLE